MYLTPSLFSGVMSLFENLMEGVRPRLRKTHSCAQFCDYFRKLLNILQPIRGLHVN